MCVFRNVRQSLYWIEALGNISLYMWFIASRMWGEVSNIAKEYYCHRASLHILQLNVIKFCFHKICNSLVRLLLHVAIGESHTYAHARHARMHDLYIIVCVHAYLVCWNFRYIIRQYSPGAGVYQRIMCLPTSVHWIRLLPNNVWVHSSLFCAPENV
jgi:hypothetical protein